jgi:hypothetical protein
MSAGPEPNWTDPTWLLAVMRYPRDAAMRESYCEIRQAQQTESVSPAILNRAADAMLGPSTRNARRAITGATRWRKCREL